MDMNTVAAAKLADTLGVSLEELAALHAEGTAWLAEHPAR